MARSRRTGSKGPKKITKERKLNAIEAIQSALKSHPHVYLYRLENPRNAFFQRIRHDLADTCIFWLGKNKVLQRALGKDTSAAIVPGIEQIAGMIRDNTGLLLSQFGRAALEDALAAHSFSDYGRAGSIAPLRVCITVGEDRVLARVDNGEPIGATAEPVLRAAGMPTMLRGGTVLLAQGREFVVCEAGDRLTANQARVLKTFGVQTDEFAVRLLAHFDCGSGKLEQF